MKISTFLYSLIYTLVIVNADTNLVTLDILEYPNDVKTFHSTFLEICSNFIGNISGVTKSCEDQLRVVCDLNNTLLTTMLDASSKFPWSGLKYTSLLDYGNYDECIEIEHEEVVEGNTIRILGKHCNPGFVIPISESQIYKLAICVPDKCTKDDLIELSGGLKLFVGEEKLCSTKESGTDFSAGDVAIIVIFGVFIVILLISTLYDVYLHQTGKKSPNPLLLAFSVLSNGKKLVHTSKRSKEQIMVFHGLKFISMWWIIAGHTYSGWTSVSVLNQAAEDNFLGEKHSFYITTGHLAVDTFFYISGFLLAYQYLKQKQHPLRKHLTVIPKLMLHRYLRLTPVALMAYLFMIGILAHLGSGPMFFIGADSLAQPCFKYWWSYFLYLQNYVNPTEICMTHTWYLSADMQLFFTAPIAMIPVALYIKKKFKITMICLLALNLFFTVLPLINVIWQDLWYNEFDSHSKLIDYWIGFMLGAYMREMKDKPFKISRVKNILIWIIVLVEMIAVIALYKYIEITYGYVEIQVFYAIMRPAWCIGLSWIVFASYHGYGGFVNWFLSSPAMQVGGKLTYCLYISHGIIVAYYILIGKSIKYFSEYIVFYEWCGAFVMSMVIGTITTLAFESPIIILEKALLGGGSKPRKPATQTPNEHHKTEKTEAQQA